MMSVVFRATWQQMLEMNRASRLAYGHYAWADIDGEQKVEEAGSGILIAPCLGLTAKHVTTSFFKLDPQFDSLLRRFGPLDPQYQVIKHKSEFAGRVYQAPFEGAEMNWLPEITWPSLDTDISCMVLEARSDAAIALASESGFLEWQLLPPRVGSVVTVYGWPGQKINVHTNDEHLETHDIEVGLRVESAYVTEYCPVMKEHGLRAFTGFVLNRELPHGFSGAPVLQRGRLIGIFSGPDYVTSLWPLAHMTYPDLNEVEHSFQDLFDNGTISAIDWDEVKGHVVRKPCEKALAGSLVETRCHRQHVVLTG